MSEQTVDFVLDTYNSLCLQDITRDMRGDNLDDSGKIRSFGCGQKTPSNFLNLLKFTNYKKAFWHFFYHEIQKNEYANIFDHKVFYCSVDNECICLQCDEEGMLQVDVHDLYGTHDEADTRVAFHAVHVEQLNPGNIVIRCNDTDILIIMLSNIQKFSQSHVWLDMGLDYNNSHTFINVKRTADKLNFTQALPGIYAFTGCDYTPAFFRQGKKRPIEIMLKSVLFINTFNKMGEEYLSDEDIDAVESFTCSYVWLQQINIYK